MKANELSIGDFVQFNGSPYVVEELSAQGWMHLTDPVHNLRVQMSSDYIYDFIEGVPLTEEILQKNFPNTDDGLTWWPITETDTFSVHIDIPDSEDHDKYAHIYTGVIRYVHELQHILTLCHITKDIEL